ERAWLLAHDTDAAPAPALGIFEALCARRVHGEPLAYLVGHKEFFGLELAVDARVLTPRPDTETLVEWALQVLASEPAPRVIDLGTGSGAIALAIKRHRPDAFVAAIDRSAGALEVARANGQRLALEVDWRDGNWLDGAAGGWRLIVSNPPYVAQDDPHLQALKHEPLSALASGADGLDDLRAIVSQAPAKLAAGGWLLLEHGWDQAAAVRELLTQTGFHDVASRKDLAGHDRCSGGLWPGASERPAL
ncbi:MAG TPA: peptide chain release factor N(5)-glutamine methyltransferase, partial [Ramlibacter sp.]|nr:peptide chain release factor N(5)-glutamine methyltransferase [Ramlibacter sp.]